MNVTLDKLYNLLNTTLYAQAPRLSGNMASGIKIQSISDDEVVIVIDAPFYNINEWRKSGKIMKTGKTINGKTDYAMWVNNLGAFNTGNSSMHWVNRVCYEVAKAIAGEINAEVINELPLD